MKPAISRCRGARALKARQTAGRTRRERWLERQLNDPYVARAKREGLRSRAAFKLIEIDDKHQLLKPGAKVVDLGAAPGGWSQVAAKRVRAGAGGGRVVAIDLLAMDPLPGVEILQIDFLDPDAPERLKRMLGGPADVVLSDMAANATGHRQDRSPQDHGARRSRGRVRARGAQARAALFSPRCSRAAPRASCSPTLKRDFASVKHVKPAASRSDSAELYVLATGFRGRAVES